MDKWMDNDWWKQDPVKKDVWHRFEKEDYIRKINKLFIHISDMQEEHEDEIKDLFQRNEGK